MVSSPAFDLIRRFKDVNPDTERLVLKKVKNKITQDDLISAFEKGVSGEYGKFIAADPQTLINWVNKFLAGKDSSKNYLQSGLVPVNITYSDRRYPLTADDWRKEVNKCYHAFLQGVSHTHFHPLCYAQMLIDNKIILNEYRKKVVGEETDETVRLAQQVVISEKFNVYRKLGYPQVYIISDESR